MDDLATVAKRMGIELDTKSAAALTKQIDACNGNRKKLRLSYEDALHAVVDAKDDPHGIGVRHAGAELLGRTTIALAVKTSKGFVLAVQGLWADRPTPGRAWKDLQPWMQDFAKNAANAAAWAKKKNKDRVLVGIGTASASAKPAGKAADGKKLFAAILADPRDTQARLVYADWLTEQGDPRGEFIAVQCELAGAKAAKKRQLAKREKELLRKNARAWNKSAMQDAEQAMFDRGFIGVVEMTGVAWAAKGAKLFASDPIATLWIAKTTGAGLEKIAAAPHTAKLDRIETKWDALWMRTPKDAKAINTFLRSKYVGQVREIAIRVSRERSYLVARDPVDLGELFAGVALPNVESLEIDIQRVPDSALQSLAGISAPKLASLAVHASKKQRSLVAALKKKFPKATIR